MTSVLTSCGKKEDNSVEKAGDIDDTVEKSYEGIRLPLGGMEGKPVQYCTKNNKIYILTCQQPEQEMHTGHKLYVADMDGTNLSEIPLNLADDEKIEGFSVGNENKIIYITSLPEGEKTVCNELTKIDMEGKEIQKEDITKTLGLHDDVSIKGIVEPAEGNVVVVTDEKVSIFGDGFSLVKEVASEKGCRIADVAHTKDGDIVCALKKTEQLTQEEAVNICRLDIKAGAWEKVTQLGLPASPEDAYIMDGYEYDFYFRGNYGIYGYDIESENDPMLVDGVASGLNPDDTVGFVPTEDGRFISTQGEGDGELYLYSKVDQMDLQNKKTIVYGGTSIAVKNAAMEFNKKNKDCRVIFRDYSEEEDPMTKLNADIIAGNAPDIIDLEYFGISPEKCVSMGLLEDLTSYYEKDAELNEEDMIPSVLHAMQINGKLYYVAPGFTMSTIIGKQKDVGDENGWTFDELKGLINEKGEDVSVFALSTAKDEILYNFLLNSLMDFVNWDTGECTFDSQEFRNILELSNENGEMDDNIKTDTDIEEFINSQPDRLREGSILLYEVEDFTIEQVQTVRQLFDADITCIGYPNEEKLGSFFSFGNRLGICAKSEVKEDAWKFIRTFMTREYQGKNMNPESMPTRKDCFDLQIEAVTATKPYTDEFGREIEPLNDTWNYGTVELQLQPLSQKEVDIYVNLVNTTKKSSDCDEKMLDIIMEEVQPYFNGRKSLDKTVKIIQKRISTYVNEQR